jgi:hypothetical protein
MATSSSIRLNCSIENAVEEPAGARLLVEIPFEVPVLQFNDRGKIFGQRSAIFDHD